MRVRLHNQKEVGTITDVYERGVAGSDVTYVTSVAITYDTGLVIKCDPSLCTLAEEE